MWAKTSGAGDFYHKFRVDFFGWVYELERDSKCVLDECANLVGVPAALSKGIDEANTFVELCLYKKKEGKKTKSNHPQYKTKIYETYVDFKMIPSPKMIHAVNAMFVYVAFGSYKGLKLIHNVGILHGKPTSGIENRRIFENFEVDSQYVPEVSSFRRKSVSLYRFHVMKSGSAYRFSEFHLMKSVNVYRFPVFFVLKSYLTFLSDYSVSSIFHVLRTL